MYYSRMDGPYNNTNTNNSSKPDYANDNVQWVHKDVNYMKMDLTQEEFIKYCKLIAKANENK